MAIQTQNGETWMEQFFGKIEVGNVKERGYKLRIAVAGYRVTPRDKAFEYFRDMGMQHLESILHQKTIGLSYMALVFPERWLSVHEQQQLIYAIDKHPDVKSKVLTAVDIFTQNPLIVGGCYKGEVVKFDVKGSRGLTGSELHAVINGTSNVNELYEMLSRDGE